MLTAQHKPNYTGAKVHRTFLQGWEAGTGLLEIFQEDNHLLISTHLTNLSEGGENTQKFQSSEVNSQTVTASGFFFFRK